MKRTAWMLVVGWILTLAQPVHALTFEAFGARGAGGVKNRQDFRIGPGGVVQELDAFLSVGTLDLNGDAPGGAAQLSRHELPAGLGYEFTATPAAGGADVLLTYRFTNTTSVAFANLRLLVMLDTEIDETVNTFFNEYGATNGSVQVGNPGEGADQWQIDEPGFRGGSLYRNLFLGALSNANSVPEAAPDDVALALGFSLGQLKPGESTAVRVLISEAGHTRGTLALVQRDTAAGSSTTITMSGDSDAKGAPFQSTGAAATLSFTWRLNTPVGSLLGTLTIQNRTDSTIPLGPPYQLGLTNSTRFWYAHPAGALPNGLPYVDLTAAIAAKLGQAARLEPSQAVTIDPVEVYSRDRTPPPVGAFDLWATPLR